MTGYNNYYEFGTGKDDPARNAGRLRTRPWKVEIAGEVKRPAAYDLEELLKPFTPTERVYRMRCVEGRSMVIPWLGTLGGADSGELNITEPEFIKGIDRLVRTVSLNDWKHCLLGRLIASVAPWLGARFVAENLHFRRRLTGVTELPPLWDRCLRATEHAMGQALGRAFVKRTLGSATRERVGAMVVNLRAVLRDRLASIEWMSDTTRAQALSKLDALTIQIGYPDRWRDYSALRVESGPFVRNVLRAKEFSTGHELARIGKPADRGDWWSVTPQTPDAFYSALMNTIVVPAGILQAPLFDAGADDAINYGAIGAFIGHELTHAFDDQGRQFDAEGNLRDWWTPADAARFTERARGLVEQFDSYAGVDSLHVNGALTLSENIADLGGLRIAFQGLRRVPNAKARTRIDGFTPEQRFFIGWAQIWRANIRPEEARLRLRLDPHAPWRTRVNGPLSNMPEFAEAFGCRLGDPMVRLDSLQIAIW